MTIGPAPDSDLTFAWLTDPSGIAASADEWQALAEVAGAEVYQRPDWITVWLAHFGQGRRLACLVARADGALVGMLPFVIERHWLGPVPLRIARLAGIDPNCIVFRLALQPDQAEPVLREAMAHLIGVERCIAVSFTPVSGLSPHLAALQGLNGFALHLEPAGNHVVFDLSEGFETYLGALTKKRRGQFRRDVKSLVDDYGMVGDDFAPTTADFDSFVSFHNRQWQAVGKGGHFSDWPGSAAFYRDLAFRTRPSKLVRMDRLLGTDGPLAEQFSLVGGTTAHWRLPARRLDPDVERLSVGKVALLVMLERMAAEGITRIEAGRGDYGYKLDYGGQSVPVYRVIVYGRANGLRLKALLAWADLIHLLYYRIWFLKLAPRLRQKIGGRPRPLWRLWIRTRL